MDAPVTPEISGESESFIEAKIRLSRAAKVNRPILIIGERGSGKELAAARLHYLSPRWRGPYVTLNCAALSPNLAESELFGYEPGAFTGAARVAHGRFEAADGGTLFLDEISHLGLEIQAKILRVVEYGSFQRLGSHQERRVDVRLVSATNVDLRQRAATGAFLPDLLDRLSFEVIVLPPLRERAGDVPLLAHLFAGRMAAEMSLPETPAFTPEALEALEQYDWPGNVRELKNVVERAVYRVEAPVITPADLELTPPTLPAAAPAGESAPAAASDAGGARRDLAPALPLAENEFDRLLAAAAARLIKRALLKAPY
ncbi:MAG: sigma 54-interacting transcriptional regulator, partial [Candidatus Adiutrix sp.]|nr:sigma 54-interacting transcriptional regulator [Candidatus Adiutrix sp.]